LILFLRTRSRSGALDFALIARRTDLALSSSYGCRVSSIKAVDTSFSVTADICRTELTHFTLNALFFRPLVVSSRSALDVVPSPAIFAFVARRALVASSRADVSLPALSNCHWVDKSASHCYQTWSISYVVTSLNDLALNISFLGVVASLARHN
jgi:hypothetical protein